MTLEVTDLSQLPAEDVTAALEKLTQQVQEVFPNLRMRSGVIHEIVLELYAVLQTTQDINWDRLRQSLSLSAVAADPTLADDGVVDGILSNYLLTRTPGTPASGTITILLSLLAPTTVGEGTEFFANGVTFITEATYTARVDASSVTAETDRELQAVGDGTYSFTIPVVATTTEAAGALRQGTRLITDASLDGLLQITATGDFSGGVPTETNAELVAKQAAGLSIAAFADRDNIAKLIRKQTAFSLLSALSIIGCGDTEMTRDQHGLCPISHGGKVDIYVRSQAQLQTNSQTVTATYVEQGDGGGIWQFSLDADVYPGFYRVRRVYLPDTTASGFEQVFMSLGIATLEDTDPAIETVEEAAFTAYQTATIRFLDTTTPTASLTAGDTAEYVAEIDGLPLISELQSFCRDRDSGSPTSDVLVRAAIPCILEMSFILYKPAQSAEINQTTIATALADYVNTLGFTGRVYCSALSHIVFNNLPANVNVGRIELSGKLYPPGDDSVLLRSFDVLEIPESGYVSSRTVCFFLNPADVSIQIEVV